MEQRFMQNQSKNNIVPLLFMVFALFFLFLLFNQGVNRYDEGIFVYGAEKILDGDIPYKDFWAIYFPAQFYTLAALFKLFGPTMIAARICSTLIRYILVIMTYVLARKFVSQKYALIASFLLLIWLGSYQFYENPMLPALVFSLASFLAFLRFIRMRHRRWLFVCGVLVGVTTLYRQDMGAYTFLSTILVAIPFVFVNETSKDDLFFKKIYTVSKYGSSFILGTIVILFPVVLYFLLTVPADDLIYDFITFPLKIYPSFRALPFPAPIPNPALLLSGSLDFIPYVKASLRQLPLYSPVLIYFTAIFIFMVGIRKKTFDWKKKNTWALLFILLLGLLSLNYVRVRTHTSHLMGTFIPSILLFVFLLSLIPKSGKIRPVLWLGAFLLGFSFVGFSIGKTAILFHERLFSQNKRFYTIERAKGLYETKDRFPGYQSAVELIQKNVPADEKIFVGNTRHDRIVLNDILFYFLSDRHSATKYYDLHPGIATTVEIQEKIIADIEHHRVNYIVLVDQSWIKRWENDRVGSRLLDNFIHLNFTQERQCGNYSVWKRNR
jgi:4-amino-4-deoxy-L-arabinose transferase-like glycosyltransferase